MVNMGEVSLTKRASEKYKLLLNGIKESVNKFLDNLSDDKIKIQDLKMIPSLKSNNITFYYRKYESMYVILVPLKKISTGKYDWLILDFLTTDEFSVVK